MGIHDTDLLLDQTNGKGPYNLTTGFVDFFFKRKLWTRSKGSHNYWYEFLTPAPDSIFIGVFYGPLVYDSVTITTLRKNYKGAYLEFSDSVAAVGKNYELRLNSNWDKKKTVEWTMEKGPKFLSMEAATGVLKGIPTASNLGRHKIVIKAEDSFGFARDSFEIKVAYAPSAYFSWTPFKISPEDTVQFTNMSTVKSGTITKTIWRFSPVDTFLTWHAKYQFPQLGDYNVTLSVKANDLWSDIAIKIPVRPKSIDKLVNRPAAWKLDQNYPNPFNPETQISFGIKENSNVKVTIYDALGRNIKTLVNEKLTAGFYKTNWKGLNSGGLRVPTGIYYYSIQTDKFTQTRKMLLLK